MTLTAASAAAPLGATVVAGPEGLTGEALWADLADRLGDWAAGRGVPLRDAGWLLPFSALLPLARNALSRRAGWQPRVETVATWVQQSAPAAASERSGFSSDRVTQRLQAQALLRGQAWGKAWSLRDPPAFAHAVSAVVDAAQAWHAAACARPPLERAAWWALARRLLADAGAPAATEAALARIALEWVACALDEVAPPTDRLFDAPVSAWIGLRAGGVDPLTQSLLDHAAQRGVPVLWFDLDGPVDAAFALAAARPAPGEWVCADAEAEARAAAACVLHALQVHPQGVVALVAQDRETVRRARALLQRAEVPVVDDTGWRLSTTRAGARVAALLRAARSLRGAPGSDAQDVRLAWLKDDRLGLAEPDALRALEAGWRGRRVGDAAAAQAKMLWRQAESHLAALLDERVLPLDQWLHRLASCWLDDEREAARWRDDAAGRAVLRVLRLEAPWNAAQDWCAVARATRFTLDEFIAWVDSALDDASVVVDNPPEARVVIAPLARVMLRPFVAAVCPAADELRLGAVDKRAGLLSPGLCRELGLPDEAMQQQRQTAAFLQLLRLPDVCLVRRQAEGAELLGPSPLVERLVLARREAGQRPAELPAVEAPLPQAVWQAQPVMPPLPRAGTRWPASLSASAVESLRTCPYRFFSRTLLGLAEDDELDQVPDKRDYGVWLHAVLMRFHSQRAATDDPGDDLDRLRACAREIDAEQGLVDGELLPFQASFEALLPSYLAWLHEREAQGWRWQQGEVACEAHPAELAGMGLHGRLDRLDAQADGRVQLLDYKTGSAAGLEQKVREPLEDTQLAFYAVLALAGAGVPAAALSAAYLALDERDGLREVKHPDVAVSAHALVAGLAGELQRLRAGEPLQALGRGSACEHCEARGLCRRDHWAGGVEAPEAGPA